MNLKCPFLSKWLNKLHLYEPIRLNITFQDSDIGQYVIVVLCSYNTEYGNVLAS